MTQALAAHVLDACRAAGLTVATAESCTGGLIAGALTDIAGSSDVFDRGFVSYSNAAKGAMLGVDPKVLERCGAVSRDVAIAMADGTLAHAPADLAVAVTGIAGPAGGSPDKPVGLVHLAARRRGGGPVHRERRYGAIGRQAIRAAAVDDALRLLLDLIRR